MILSRKLTCMAAFFVTMTVTFMTTTSTAQQDEVYDEEYGASSSFTSIFDIPPRSSSILSSSSSSSSSSGSDGLEEDDDTESAGAGTTLPRTPEEKHRYQLLKSKRMAERRERARKVIAKHRPEPGQLHRMSPDEIRRVYGNAVKEDPALEQQNHKWLRGLGGGNGGYYYGSHVPNFLAPVDQYYDPWAQAYRMLGGYIDCDHAKDNGHGGSHDNNKNQNQNNQNTCSRWMMWAAYVDPNYSGGGRNEYFQYGNGNANRGDYYEQDEQGDKGGVLDCHSPNTEWQLIGVYRQEFYQFIEQISKHLWAIDDYEYVVALAGLAYMTDADCMGIGYDNEGNFLYAGVMPYSGGMFKMALYQDSSCLIPDTKSGKTFDDFGMTSNMNLGSKDDGTMTDDTLGTLYKYWNAAQEYTLELVNEVYNEYKYCTLCMDYPTYQDGYFIGDTGTDDDDLINQCWKFHSHDSYTCETDCISLGNAQGSILQVNYAGRSYGTSWDGSGNSGGTTVYDHYAKGYTNNNKESNFERFKANAYLTFNGVLFIATFLAFSVARGSRIDSSDKSRSLLSREDRKKSRSNSNKKSSSSRSKSAREKQASSGNSRSSSKKKRVMGISR
mmetsp:Transcript_4206/g.8025  ORF Transcript_4206/g.8025 Transcript_4206/m.8025 type:complete len:610 (+) Transcript_4206:472-2301(+)